MATKLFTPQQRVAVDAVLDDLSSIVATAINQRRLSIELLDDRPVGCRDSSNPDDKAENYRFPYVAQGMLEDLIERLEAMV